MKIGFAAPIEMADSLAEAGFDFIEPLIAGFETARPGRCSVRLVAVVARPLEELREQPAQPSVQSQDRATGMSRFEGGLLRSRRGSRRANFNLRQTKVLRGETFPADRQGGAAAPHELPADALDCRPT
jgi:hypothetical protein